MGVFLKNVCIHFLLQVINGTLFSAIQMKFLHVHCICTSSSMSGLVNRKINRGGRWNIIKMPSVPVRARLLVLGIANLVGLCGERTPFSFGYCQSSRFMW